MGNKQKRRPSTNKRVAPNKKWIGLAVGVVAVAAIGIGVNTYLSSEKVEDTTTLEQTENNLPTTITNVTDFKNFFSSLTLDESVIYDMDAYKAYLKQIGFERITVAIEQEIEHLQDTKENQATVSVDGEQLFNIQKNNTGYTLKPIAHTINAKVLYEGLTLDIAGQSYKLNSTDVAIGPLLPGTYQYVITGEMDGYAISEQVELFITSATKQIIIEPTKYTVNFTSKFEDVGISVNGEINYGMGAYIPKLYIPIGNKAEVVGVIEYEGVEYKTNVFQVSNTQTIDLAFPELELLLSEAELTKTDLPNEFPEEEIEQEIYVGRFAEQLFPEFTYAYSNNDLTTVQSFIDPSSAFYATHTKKIQANIKENTDIESTLTVVEETNRKGLNLYEIIVSESYNVTKLNEETKTVTQTCIYTTKFINGELKIINLQMK